MQGGILDKLADCLSKSLTELQAAHAASAEELHDKFLANRFGRYYGYLSVARRAAPRNRRVWSLRRPDPRGRASPAAHVAQSSRSCCAT